MLRQICSPTTKPATTNPDHLGAWLGPLHDGIPSGAAAAKTPATSTARHGPYE